MTRPHPPRRLPIVPASFFGMVLGLVGLGNGWRVAARLWHAPALVGEVILLAGAVVWAVLAGLYLAKWRWAPAVARAELDDGVQSGFVSLLPLSTMLMALVLAPYAHGLAMAFWLAGVAGQLVLGVTVQGRWWQGGRGIEAVTTSLYLPTVGVNFVAATVAGALGHADWGALFFGAGALAWLSIESVVLHRHALGAPLPLKLRATLGIQLAPPVVGAMAYLGITTGHPDLFLQALFGYGLYQALLLLRLLPWLREQPFSAGAWGFTFGVTAIAVVPMRMLERGDTGPAQWLALPLFAFANVFIAALVAGTARLAWRGTLLPPPASAAPPVPTAHVSASAVGSAG